MIESVEAADILVKYSSLNNFKALETSEISINQIDWEKIGNSPMTKQEEILIDVLRFLLLNQARVTLYDLLTLNDIDIKAVLLALNTKYGNNR